MAKDKKKEPGDATMIEAYSGAAGLLKGAAWAGAGAAGLATLLVPKIRCKVVSSFRDFAKHSGRPWQRPLSVFESELGKARGFLTRRIDKINKDIKAAGGNEEKVAALRKEMKAIYSAYETDPLVTLDKDIRGHNEEKVMIKRNFNKHKSNLLKLYEDGKIPSPVFANAKKQNYEDLEIKLGKELEDLKTAKKSEDNDLAIKLKEKEIKRVKRVKLIDPESFDAKVTDLLDNHIEADELIGTGLGGKSVKTIRERIVENGSSGIKPLDTFLEQYGEPGLEALETISKLFREGGKMVGLPPERFRKSYFPRLEKQMEKVILNAESVPDGVGKYDLKPRFEEMKKAFFFNQRTRETFDGSGVSILEAIQRYEAGIERTLDQRLFVKLADIKASGALDDYHATVGGAVDGMIKQLIELPDTPHIGTQWLDYFRNRFYSSTLTNNISSTINNYTQLLNIVATEYGYKSTLNAMREVFKGADSKYAPLIEAMDITPERALMNALDIINLQEIPDSFVVNKFYDIFSRSEAFMQAVSGISHLEHHFRGDMPRLDALLKSTKSQDIFDLATIARTGIMDTMFTNIGLNRSVVDNSAFGRAATTFLRHQMRETRYVVGLVKDITSATTQSRSKAIQKFSRYLLHKTIFLGGQSPWLFVPAIARDVMNKYSPETMEAIYATQFMINNSPLGIPYAAMNAAGVDFSEQQGLFDVSKFFDNLFNSDQDMEQFPIFSETKSVWNSLFGKGAVFNATSEPDIRTQVKMALFGLAYAPGNVKIKAGPVQFEAGNGIVKVNGIPIGAKQIRKVLNALIDISEERSVFFGEKRDVTTGLDKLKALEKIAIPSAADAQIIKRKKNVTPKDTIVGLTIKGKKNKELFDEYVKLYGDKKGAIKALKQKTTKTLNKQFADKPEKDHKVEQAKSRIEHFYR